MVPFNIRYSSNRKQVGNVELSARISCIARLIADMRLAALYLWHYILYMKNISELLRVYTSHLRKFSNIQHFKKSTVYCARYDRPDRYMRSSESEGFDNSKVHSYKKLECLKNKSYLKLLLWKMFRQVKCKRRERYFHFTTYRFMIHR